MARRVPTTERQSQRSADDRLANPPLTRSRGRRIAGAWLGVCVLVAIVHWPVLSARAISMDDERYLFANITLMRPNAAHLAEIWREVLHSSTIEGYYEPLTLTSLMADVAMGGTRENLYPFHRTSLALHVINTLLIIVLLHELFGNPWLAAAAGLLFALHPLTVEPIAWVWERKTLLATGLVLGAMILYVRYARTGGYRLYISAVGLFALALLAKPTVTPLPVLLLLLDIWPLGRLGCASRGVAPGQTMQPGLAKRSIRRLLWEKVPFLAVATISGLITVISTSKNASISFLGHTPLFTHLLQVCYVLIFYLGKILWPVKLSPVYVLPSPLAITSGPYLGALAGVLLLAVVITLARRSAPVLAIGMLFFFLALLPTFGIIRYSWVCASDKYVYFPSVGILLIVAWVLPHVRAGKTQGKPGTARSVRASERMETPASSVACTFTVPRAGIYVIALLAGAEAIASRQQIACWHDTQTLFAHMLAVSPDSGIVHRCLGDLDARNARFEPALEHYQRALQLEPNDADTLVNMGAAFQRLGHPDQAAPLYARAVEINPFDAGAHTNLGLVLSELGQADAALPHFREAVRLSPRNAEAQNNLGMSLAQRGEFEEAIEHFEKSLSVDPDDPQTRHNLVTALIDRGDALSATGQRAAAIAFYRRALGLDPTNDSARSRMSTPPNK